MKKKDNKLYDVDDDIRHLVATALIADITAALMLIASIVILIFTIYIHKEEPVIVNISDKQEVIEEVQTQQETVEESSDEPAENNDVVMTPVKDEEPTVVLPLTDEEIELLALVTMAEAEGESEEGKRLVIDTVLNRVDSDIWPDTVREVIFQPGQFTSMWNGRVDRCHVTDEVRALVVEELLSRTNDEVVYFAAGGYGRYGTPVFQVGNHYFCTI